MKNHDPEYFDSHTLKDSLTPLGIRQIAERMEVSPLLVDQGDLTQGQDASICCTCKIPWDHLDESGNVPVMAVEPPLGAGGSSSGLLTPPIWPY